MTHSMTEREAITEWYGAHERYHQASAIYNNRLLLVRAERERGNWTMNVNEEYATLNATKNAALQADTMLYDAIRCANGEQVQGDKNV